MNEHDGPPNLISDEWEQRHEPRLAPVDPDGLEPEDDQRTPIAPVVAEVGLPPTEALGPDEYQQAGPLQQPMEEPSLDRLDSIQAELTALRAETVHVNRILDRLHAENERLQRGESEQILMPLFRDLVKMADDWTAMAASWESKETATPTDVAKRCRDVADDAGLILGRYGVDPLTPSVGAPIERKQHRVVGTVTTDSLELDKTVAEVRRVGYIYGEKVLKFAEVIVVKHEG